MSNIIPIKPPIKLEWQEVTGTFGGKSSWLDCGEFYISFNSAPGESNPFDLLTSSERNRGKPETALVSERNGDRKFYILYGDWRKAYEQVAHLGFAACYGIFAANLGLIGDSSNHPLEETP